MSTLLEYESLWLALVAWLALVFFSTIKSGGLRYILRIFAAIIGILVGTWYIMGAETIINQLGYGLLMLNCALLFTPLFEESFR